MFRVSIFASTASSLSLFSRSCVLLSIPHEQTRIISLSYSSEDAARLSHILPCYSRFLLFLNLTLYLQSCAHLLTPPPLLHLIQRPSRAQNYSTSRAVLCRCSRTRTRSRTRSRSRSLPATSTPSTAVQATLSYHPQAWLRLPARVLQRCCRPG